MAMFMTMADTVEPEKMVRSAPERPDTTGFMAARRQYRKGVDLMAVFKKKKPQNDESRYMASQWKLMWIKLKKHKLAKFILRALGEEAHIVFFGRVLGGDNGVGLFIVDLLELVDVGTGEAATALKSQDMYLAGTIVLVQAILVVVGTLLSDIALAWLDPKYKTARTIMLNLASLCFFSLIHISFHWEAM